jgi:hypothetical protein
MTKIEIDLDELMQTEEGGESVVDRIVSQSARYLADAMKTNVREKAETIAKEQIDAYVKAQLATLMEQPIVETDCWGHKRSGETCRTMAEVVVEKAVKHLNEMVNKRGDPAGYSDEKMSRAQWMAKNAAEKMVQEALKPELDKAIVEFKKQVGVKLSEAFKKAFTEVLKG